MIEAVIIPDSFYLQYACGFDAYSQALVDDSFVRTRVRGQIRWSLTATTSSSSATTQPTTASSP